MERFIRNLIITAAICDLFFFAIYLEEMGMSRTKSNGERRLSAKQKQILDYIKEDILKKGYPPTVREICETVGLRSTSSVHAHLSTLEKNGFIRRDPTKPRAIEICDDSFQVVRTEMASLPEIGDVAATSLSPPRSFLRGNLLY